MLSRRDDHGFFELILVGIVELLVREPYLVVPDGQNVAILQGVFLYQLAIDVSAIGAVQILKKRVVENIDDQRVMPTDSGVVDANIVIRKTTNGIAFLGHVVFSQNLIVQAKN